MKKERFANMILTDGVSVYALFSFRFLKSPFDAAGSSYFSNTFSTVLGLSSSTGQSNFAVSVSR